MLSLGAAVVALALMPPAIGQFVKAPAGLNQAQGYANISVRYKEVPTGICELDPDVKSYSGYADVGVDEHIFWWFFEARNVDPTSAPLTVWINGGPGSSSMIGLFQENGPCGIDSDGNVYNNPFSWSNISNMLYVDQPVQVGFSYSIPVPGYVDPNNPMDDIETLPNATCPDYATSFGTCGTYSYPNYTLTANSTAAAAPNMWKTLQGFMGAFPQYSRDGFHFATESYGGHYGPVFSEYFEQQNALNIPGAQKINLESALIGNGWFDPLIQLQSYYNFTVSPGNTYDLFPFNASIAAMMYNNLYGPGNCVGMTKDCNTRGIDEVCTAADIFCYYEVEALYDTYAGRDEYDIRELVPDPFPYPYFVEYLNTPAVQAAVGAYQNFSRSSGTVSNAFETTGDDDREANTIEDVRLLLGQNVTVVMFYGDADYNVNWIGGEAVAEEIDAAGFSSAGYANFTTSDNAVHGQVKQSGLYSFVRVYDSGHLVPFYQPLAALTLFERAINGLDIATGTQRVTSDYLTVGTPKSTYREGNATIQFEVLPSNATYNTTLNGPNPTTPLNTTMSYRKSSRQSARRKFRPGL